MGSVTRLKNIIPMATYPGLSLRGEVRESVSLDEDDLSDVEDEVFIRDGKSGYKVGDNTYCLTGHCHCI